MMKDFLLKFACCPKCHGNLELNVRSRSGAEILEGTLSCAKCSRSYSVIRGIPRFVESDAYARSFSIEWNIFSKTQLDLRNCTVSRDTFFEKTGTKLDELAGASILEAGCGMGRFLQVVSAARNATIIGFDLSLAVEAAYENVGRSPNVCIVQADIMELPFRKEDFDYVYSIGAIHHTSDPKRAFFMLVPLVRPGGQIAIWVYQKYGRPELSDLYRIATKRMPWSMVLAISKLLSSLHWISLKWRYFRGIIPMSDAPDPDWRTLDNFDWYSPRYQFKYAVSEVVCWFKDAGLKDIRELSLPVSVKARKTEVRIS
jgi:SAM-dependent methyltransferase